MRVREDEAVQRLKRRCERPAVANTGKPSLLIELCVRHLAPPPLCAAVLPVVGSLETSCGGRFMIEHASSGRPPREWQLLARLDHSRRCNIIAAIGSRPDITRTATQLTLAV